MKKITSRTFVALLTAVMMFSASFAGYAEETAGETDTDTTVWKAEITDYDSSLSLVEYEEITPSEEQKETIENATAPVEVEPTEIASSGASGGSGVGAAGSLATGLSSGEIAFTTYGYGHCVGMSQNGANYYATYGGYDYQSILFHYYPGTSLVQAGAQTITCNGVTGSELEIVSQLVYNEMSSTMAPEAMKAQAVAAYTYVLYNGGSVNNVALKANPPQNVIDAVSSVLGQVLYYNGSYALTVYGASSGGATADSGDVFGTSYPYLCSVASEYDASYDPNYGIVKTFSQEYVRNVIANAYGVNLTGSAYNWFSLTYGDGGFIKSVTIGGTKTVNGYQFATTLGLRSSRFAIAIG